MGRKNWLFVGSEDGATANTTFISLIASCELHGIEPWRYEEDRQECCDDDDRGALAVHVNTVDRIVIRVGVAVQSASEQARVLAQPVVRFLSSPSGVYSKVEASNEMRQSWSSWIAGVSPVTTPLVSISYDDRTPYAATPWVAS